VGKSIGKKNLELKLHPLYLEQLDPVLELGQLHKNLLYKQMEPNKKCQSEATTKLKMVSPVCQVWKHINKEI
jgi:hypothetical protein